VLSPGGCLTSSGTVVSRPPPGTLQIGEPVLALRLPATLRAAGRRHDRSVAAPRSAAARSTGSTECPGHADAIDGTPTTLTGSCPTTADDDGPRRPWALRSSAMSSAGTVEDRWCGLSEAGRSASGTSTIFCTRTVAAGAFDTEILGGSGRPVGGHAGRWGAGERRTTIGGGSAYCLGRSALRARRWRPLPVRGSGVMARVTKSMTRLTRALIVRAARLFLLMSRAMSATRAGTLSIM
jgi:hypothetical protein